MSIDQKEIMKQKLANFFNEEKLSKLDNKLNNDIRELESIKLDFYDNVFLGKFLLLLNNIILVCYSLFRFKML